MRFLNRIFHPAVKSTYQVYISLTSWLLPALVVLLLILQLIDPYDGWVILFAGLCGACLIGYLWVRTLAFHLNLRREMRFGWAQVGDQLEERFTLVNSGLIPGLWVEVADQSTLPGYQVSQMTGVESDSRTQWHTQGQCTRRGMFTLGPTSLHTADPLGIFRLELHEPSARTLLVTPPIVPLPEIEVARGGLSGEGRPRPDAPEQTVSAYTVREYVTGDSLRYIHWRTSARRDELYVRLLDGAPAGDWWIILDLAKDAQCGSGQDSTEEHGVILAASLADRGLRLRQAVGLASNSHELTWLQPRGGESQRWEILRSLALVSPGERSLAELLERMKPSFGKHASLILITADVSGGWIEKLLHLLWLGATPTVLLLDPVSFGGIGSVGVIMNTLTDLGIRRYPIQRELLDRPEARPGQAGHWEWRISPTGRAVAVNQPRDQSWRTLG